MERSELTRLLASEDEATAGARDALVHGGEYVIWHEAADTRSLTRAYDRRLRHTRRTGQETLGLERTVQILGGHDQPVRLGQVNSPDSSWAFMLFLAEDGRKLIACTGVKRQAR
ncbi:hypothetical protein AB0B12_14215 [Streptomyces sp. NPDC044780]|uniref:hypothetical protein n=1 Tax=unclassified Streptomyces TaxID=2593676 RepID=UPI0033E4EBC7